MSTAVSAPGKVFLAGGYLVLDRAYTALVFALSARIHVLVEDIDTSTGVDLAEIVVQSPQFRDATWNYGYHLAGDQGGVAVTQLQGSTPSSRNPFVETALLYGLTYITCVLSSSHIKPTKVTILADNDYYSNTSTTTLPSFPRFSDFAVRLQDAHKTGLGSSAALVTAFTGALLTHYLPSSLFSLSTEEGKSILHNLAQVSHCAAQGKVGSGFDIATAVYGTCVYRRFSPSILSSLGEPGSPSFSTRVKDIVNNTNTDPSLKWDTQISKNDVTIPQGMALVMCDVDCGSQTVSMVKSVLAWRQKNPEYAKELWDELQACNSVLAEKLKTGSFVELAEALVAIRALIRDMSQASNVPIEPKEQTELLDAVEREVDGVAGGVVPGAGGYDAIVLLVRDDEETMKGIKEFCEKWSKEKGGNVKLLNAKGELEGARVESAEAYKKGGDKWLTN